MAQHAVTMKDIARHLGVSINTVHKAVAGKPGVSDATRERILAYAAECGYERNMEASALRRKDVVISVCLPALDRDSRFYYGPVWDGCRAYAEEFRGQGIRMVEDVYDEGCMDETLAAVVERVEDGERLDGMVAVPPRSARGRELLERLVRAGVLVVFVSGDDPEVEGRYGAVMADFEVAGELMAEQVRNLLPGGGRVLLMAGDAFKDSHYRVARAFHAAVEEGAGGDATGSHAEGPALTVTDLFGYHERERLLADLVRQLEGDEVDAVCCVFARGGTVLREALVQTGKTGVVPAIASDVFDETCAGLEDGTFSNLVFKDPRHQAYLAMQMLGNRLVAGVEPEPEERVVSSRVSLVFRSTLEYYR